MKWQSLCALLTTVCAAGPVCSQAEQLRPGLWEHTITVKGGGQAAAAMSQSQQMMDKLPPEQRKMIEKMMADQGVAMGPNGNSVKVCMSKEDIARNTFPQQDGCTQNVTRNGAVWSVVFNCKGNPPSSGEGTVRVQSPTAYAGDFTINTVAGGKPERMQMTQAGKWLAADCGALTPKARR